LLQDIKDSTAIDPNFPALQYHSLGTFHKPN